MSTRTELPNGTVIEKQDNGTWIIKSRVSTELSDKEGQTISISELLKDVPNMMSDNPMVTLGHKDTPLGPIRDVQKVMETIDNIEVPTLIAKWELPGNRRYKRWVQKELEKGEFPEVSIKAYAFGKKILKNDAKGMTSEYPSDFEWIGFALCKKGMNKHVGHISINGKEIEKSNDKELLGNPNFMMMMKKLMDEDELPYTDALDTCKELYTDDIVKSMIEKGEVDMTPEEIEAIQKEHEALKEKYASLEKSTEGITKERDDLKIDLEKMCAEEKKKKKDKDYKEEMKKEAPEVLTKEDVEAMIAEKVDSIEKAYITDENKFDELLKAKGIMKAETGAEAPKAIIKFDELEKEQLEKLGEELFKYQHVKKSKEIDDVKSYEDMEKEAMGVPPEKKEGE